MIDLTPLDVRNKRGDFKKLMRGYDPDEVDVFLELVAERLEGLVRENIQMRERTETLQQQVSSQLGREQAVQDALVTAQELRADIKAQSQREAEHVLREAQTEARRIIAEAEAQVRSKLRGAERRFDGVNDTLLELERRRERFIKEFRQLLERELDVVEVEEAREPLEQRAIDLDLGPMIGALDVAPPSTDGSSPALEPAAPPEPAARVEPSGGEDAAAATSMGYEAGRDGAAAEPAPRPEPTVDRDVAPPEVSEVPEAVEPPTTRRAAQAEATDRAAHADIEIPVVEKARPAQVDPEASMPTIRSAEPDATPAPAAVPPPLPTPQPPLESAGSYEAEAVAEARSQVVEVRGIGPDDLPEVPRLEEVLAEAGAELADLPEDMPAVPEGGEPIDPPRITERKDDKLLLYLDSDEPER